MNDYQLVSLCKKEDENAKVTLFYKNLPLIRKQYYHMQRLFKFKIPMEKEDFEMSAWEYFVRAFTFVSLEKIRTPDNWIFTPIFKWYLQMLQRKIVTKEKPRLDDISIFFSANCISTPEEKEHDLDIDASCYYKEKDPIVEELIHKEAMKAFDKKLTPIERKVIALKLERDSEGKEPSWRAVKEKLGVSETEFPKIRRDIKSKIKKVKVAYYCS